MLIIVLGAQIGIRSDQSQDILDFRFKPCRGLRTAGLIPRKSGPVFRLGFGVEREINHRLPPWPAVSLLPTEPGPPCLRATRPTSAGSPPARIHLKEAGRRVGRSRSVFLL